MSSVTVLQQPSIASKTTAAAPQTCQQCGALVEHVSTTARESTAQQRVSELEAQVRILTDKATAAVDRLADYEDELRQLKQANTFPDQARAPSPAASTASLPPSKIPATAVALDQPAQASRPRFPARLTNLLPASSSSPSMKANAPPIPHPPSAPATQTTFSLSSPGKASASNDSKETNTKDLLNLLTREQSLRVAAERRVSQTNDEIEELSTQLFTEANEMVATERKARARLEERVAILEKRDRDKRGRLDMLEKRLDRVDRVRGLLNGTIAI